MSPLTRATENIYADDADGVRRLVAAAGDEYDPNAVMRAFGVVTPPNATPVVAPLDGYDTLSEAELLDRLPALSADELAAVQAYERAHQARGSITRYGLTSTPIAMPGANTAPAADRAPDYDAMSVEDLEAEIARRDDVDIDAIEGTGKDGNVVKADLVKALRNA